MLVNAHRCAWAALACVAGVLLGNSPSSSAADVVSWADSSAPACPAGPPTTTFLAVMRPRGELGPFRLEKTEVARVVRRGGRRFDSDGGRRAVARATGTSEGAWAFVSGTVSFANGPDPEARLTAAGDGLAFSALGQGRRVKLSVCRVSHATVGSNVDRFLLDPDDVVLLPIEWEGRSYVVAMRVLPINRDGGAGRGVPPKVGEERRRFRELIRTDMVADRLQVVPQAAPPDVSAALLPLDK